MPPSDQVRELTACFDQSRDRLLAEFCELLRFPSISSEPEFKGAVDACAGWVESFLRDAGFSVERWKTAGHDVVFAEWLEAPAAPTVLIYNHYDVQPVDPVDEWTSPPFEPRIVGDEIFARGAQDNKGQCYYVIAALRALLERDGKLPVNVKLCIEGEETGSAGLASLLSQKQQRLRADYAFIVDLGLHEPHEPALTLGVRGITTMTIEVRGASGDLHSGTHGGVVYNPNRAMAEILAELHDESGRVTVPGFYDEVVELNRTELSGLHFGFDAQQFEQMFGARAVGGERARPALERAWVRPTLEINGIGGGYTGDGFKTVIPARCIAKLSCRLVPNQEPRAIAARVEEHLRALTPDGVTLNVHHHPGVGEAVRTSASSPAVQVTAGVLADLFGRRCEFILSGGSIPIVAGIARASNAEVVMMGFGLPGDNMHAPNEHFGISRLRQGFVTIAASLERLALLERP